MSDKRDFPSKKGSPQTDALVVLKALEAEAKGPLQKVKRLEIRTQADFDLAGELLGKAKMLSARAKEREESLTKPLTGVVKDIQALFRPFRNQVREIEETKKADMLAFLSRNKEKQAKLSEDFEAGKIKKTSTLVTKNLELEVVANTSVIRKVWTAVPVSPELTPREYMVPDEGKIKEALKVGKKVKGWEWKQVDNIAI